MSFPREPGGGALEFAAFCSPEEVLAKNKAANGIIVIFSQIMFLVQQFHFRSLQSDSLRGSFANSRQTRFLGRPSVLNNDKAF